MSWSNGGLLVVVRIVQIEREVAPMVNLDEDTSTIVKRRTIKPKGTVIEKKSRRLSSEGIFAEESIFFAFNSRDFNSLILSAGHGGKNRYTNSKPKIMTIILRSTKYRR